MIELILLLIAGEDYGNGTSICFTEPDWVPNLFEWNYMQLITSDTLNNAMNYLWHIKALVKIDPMTDGCPQAPQYNYEDTI